MDTNEDFYRRVLSSDLEALEEKVESLDDLLRGDPMQDNGGLVEQIHNLQIDVAKLRSTIFMDSTGKRGLAHDVDVLMGRKENDDVSSGRRWTFWGMVLTTAISSGTLLLTKWDVVSKFFRGHPDKVDQMIERVAHPKGKHRHITIVVPPEDDD